MASPHDHGCAHHEHGHAHGVDAFEDHDARDVICVDQLSYTYPRAASDAQRGMAQAALDNVTLHVAAGCNLGIVGPNGAGKTTLLKCILGLLDGYQGRIELMGMTPRQACRTGRIVGYVPQRHEVEWRFPLSVRQVVRLGLTTRTPAWRSFAREDLQYAQHLMEQLGVAALADRPIGDLSGGQQQRTFIARALVARPPILIMDEPTVGVDEAGRQQFARLIQSLHASLNLTILLVTHDLATIASSCHRVACLNRRIHYHDAPQGLTPQVLREVFEHDIVPMLAEQTCQSGS